MREFPTLKKDFIMRTIAVNIYKYDELSPEAQEKALEYYATINTDFEWYDSTIDFWCENLALLGFTNAKVHFSGFYSQGDGACFDADLEFEILFERYVSEVLEEKVHGDIAVLRNHKSWIHDYLAENTSFHIVVVKHRYSHESTRRIESRCNRTTEGKLSRIYANFEDWLEAERRDFSCEIYKDLEREYEGLSSAESVAETIRANEFEFTEQEIPA